MRSMIRLWGGILCAAGLLAAQVNAPANLKETKDKLLAESRTAREMALQIANQLRKSADASGVRDQIATLEQHAAAIRQLVGELESSAATLTAKQRQQIETARKVAEILNVFIENKKAMLASVASPEDRENIRYQAIGVAQRAEMIEKTVAKLGL